MAIQFNPSIPQQPAQAEGASGPRTDKPLDAVRFPALPESSGHAGLPAGELHLALPAGQRPQPNWPQEVSWKDLNPPRALKARHEIELFLSLKGVPPQELKDTLDYLDKLNVDYAEIGTLVQQQLSFDRDPGDVLGAMQAYGVLLEGRNMQVTGTDTPAYQEIMDGLKNGKVRVDKDSSNPELGKSAGRYNFDQDTIYLKPGFKLGENIERSFLFHELIHGSQDVSHAKDTSANRIGYAGAETEAYKAQAEFLSGLGVTRENPNVQGHGILQPAIDLVSLAREEKKLLAQKPPNQTELAKVRKQIHTANQNMDDGLRRLYASYGKELTTDGLQHHHRHGGCSRC